MESIAPALDKVLSSSLRRVSAAEAPLVLWPLVSGSALARRTRAVGYRGGILQVEVQDPGLRTELEQLTPNFLRALGKYGVCVNRIEFVTGH